MDALKVIILVGCGCLVSSQVTSRDVVIEQGVLRGYNDDHDGVFSFYGIPYAAVPRGEDRFKAPLPPPAWSGVFNATNRDIACPQTQPSDVITMDCLVVNVYVPITNETNLPVYVYFHGGSFQFGNSVEFLPVNFAATGIIAVTFNYRVGVHGFLCLGTEFAPGNAGFKDQSAALKWVKQNVAKFGGNAENVLIAGCSAGGMSVELQVVSPMSNGLFHKVSIEGGSVAATDAALDYAPLQMAETYANTYGVTTGQDIQALKEFYRSLTDEQLSDGGGPLPPNGPIDFKACIETHNIEGVEKFLEAFPMDIIRNGNYEKRPVLTGFTPMEGLSFMPMFDSNKVLMEEDFSQFVSESLTMGMSENNRLEIAQKIKDFYFPSGEITHEGYLNFYTDSFFSYPHVLSARLHAQNSAPVYMYLWSFNGTVNLPTVYFSPIWGPGHVVQTLYLLDYIDTSIYENMTPDDFLLQDRIRKIFLNFAKYSMPIPSRTELLDAEWLPVTETTANYLDIDLSLTLSQSPLQERVEFWERLYAGATTDSASKDTAVKFMVIGVFILLAIFLYIL